MTADQINNLLTILVAFARGYPIQYRNLKVLEGEGHHWITIPADADPAFGPDCEYRIKPEDFEKAWRKEVTPPIDPIHRIARSCGYTIAVQRVGSTDFNLVAVPWTEQACRAEELVASLIDGLDARQIGPIETKAFGRRAVILKLQEGHYKAIDLSITPKVTTS